MLRQKTRILATHAVDFLHLADRIIVLKGGRVQAFGHYNELQDDPTLNEVLDIYRKQNKENEELRESNTNLMDS